MIRRGGFFQLFGGCQRRRGWIHLTGVEEAWNTVRGGPKTSQLRDSRPGGSCAKLTCGVTKRLGCKAAMGPGDGDQADLSCDRKSW